MAQFPGKFIVSLDFELMWGVRDMVTLPTYGANVRGVHQVLPEILSHFKKYDIRGTFAIVALLYFNNKAELLDNLPAQLPQYKDSNLSPYGDYIKNVVGSNSQADPYHYAPDLIQLIRDTPGQEIGTHTFSHFYCLEQGQTLGDFDQDLTAAINTAAKHGIATTSIIFPRNQVNDQYLELCAEKGIIAYRNNECSWIYAAGTGKNESLVKRFCRLLDAYMNLTGHHCYKNEFMNSGTIINIPSSRFLRPYSSGLRLLEWLRLRRIKKSMTYAAKNGLLYHLWWHPHNFGINQKKNLLFLEEILEHYVFLNKEYAFTSHTMSGFAKELINAGGIPATCP